MAKKMLIDATHPEETRVVVADGNKVDEFDFESLNKRQLAGNIYLAKVTRVEPSLQAAFIDYGGNRHGFLAFSEIHPDYYQIPKADRDALLAEEQAEAEAEAAADEASVSTDDEGEAVDADGPSAEPDTEKAPRKRSRSRSRGRGGAKDDGSEGSSEAVEDPRQVEDGSAGDPAEPVDGVVAGEPADVSEAAVDPSAESADDDPERTIAESAGLEDETVSEDDPPPDDGVPSGMDVVDLGDGEAVGPVEDPSPRGRSRRRSAKSDAASRDERVEAVAGEDDSAELRRAPKPRVRKYKIQEVVKVRQIMLVQVVKEERGNKGAAMTTYLSLAGRYCVLMPNTARGGGISRKITNAPDRKKLKEIAGEIEVPQGAGLIIRTAGARRTKSEIKRDYEYLQRQWEQVRELTLRSIAPAPIYEEGNLIHRSIRDLYNRDIDEVIVEGEDGFRQARDYMKLIMPSHAKNVKHYEDPLPLFARHQVETYLDAMFNPTVQLKSGGYIVIGITEALVAVDVNSGKSTREGSIEETALKTNLEAAEEVARQAKLRDLAGLIVIDFIDMDDRRNNAAVEKRLKDSLKSDRARIQIGRISGFGLLEMSRQRLRPGMLEATTQPCPHCHGTGLIRSDDSIALQVLRMLEEEGTRRRSREVLARLPVKVANYLMNEKREHLATIEGRYEMAIRVEADPTIIGDVLPPLEKFKTASRIVPKALTNVVQHDMSWTSSVSDDDDADDEIDTDDAADDAEPVEPEAEASAPREEADDDERPRKKRRRRSRRRKSGGGEGRDESGDAHGEGGSDDDVDKPVLDPVDARAADADVPETGEVPPPEDAPKPKSRTRSRSRRKPAEDAAPEVGEAPAEETPTEEASVDGAEADAVAATEDATEVDEPDMADADAVEASPAAPEPVGGSAEADPRPRRRSRAKAPVPEPAGEPGPAVVEAAEAVEAAKAVAPAEQEDAPARPKRRGWWRRD